MRKISRAQEQHGGLNFRNAHDESTYSLTGNHLWALNAGASHEQVRAAQERGLDIGEYAYALHIGASHEQVLHAHARGVDVFDYGEARRSNASHNEVLDAHARGVDVGEYGWTRRSGASHNEVLDAHARGLNYLDYGWARRAGHSHEQVIDAHERGVKLAHARGINIYHYGYARYAHDESVRNITQQPFDASEGTDRGGHVRRLAPGEGKHPFEPVTEDWYVYDECKHCGKQQKHENHSNVNEFHLFGSKKTANQYIEKQGDKWVITQKGTGKVLSHHDSEEKANEAFSAMMANKHGNINFDDSDWRSQYSDLDSDW